MTARHRVDTQNAERIERVSVRFENVSGPKGAPQRACRIKIVLPSSASVLVEVQEPLARVAFDEAADAAEKAVRRVLDKRRSRVRRS